MSNAMAKSAHLKLPDGRRLDFTIRVSARRKTVGFRVAREGLVVTVPHGLNESRIKEIVSLKSGWIMRKLQEFAGLPDPGEGALTRPVAFDLPALAESWRVEYREEEQGGVTARTEQPGRILVWGAVGDAAMCQAVLRRWLTLRAGQAMETRLDAVAGETGIGFRKLIIRSQRTRWGSCSRTTGVISLNCALLFLPPECLRYVMIHELCHMREANHSPRFWALVRQFEPESETIRRRMHEAWKRIPAWANPFRSGGE
jgi:predicted metal-dependent hydrolase